jgi:4'-phosphopantetheinyl transferase EntD
LAVLRRLFPSVCAVGAKAYGLTAEESFEAKALAIEAAVASRKIEFSAGRWAARRALEGAGFPGAVLPIGPDRAPIWPAGAVGSISHAAGVAVAVAAPAALVSGLGVDVERSATLTEELFGQVMIPGELDLLRRLPESAQCCYATAVFSIKEAFFKLQFPRTHTWLDFLDTNVELDRYLPRWRLAVRFPINMGGVNRRYFAGQYSIGEFLTIAAAFEEAERD